MTFTIDITNIDGSPAKFDLLPDWKFTLVFGSHGEFNATVGPRHSISRDAQIEVSEKGTIAWRGFLDEPEEQTNGTFKLKAVEQQHILFYRIGQAYDYPAATTINAILSDAVPTAGGHPGILYLAHALVPQGAFVSHYGDIYKMDYITGSNAGIYSRLGNVTACYEDDTLLTEVSSVSEMASGTFHQDTTDFYIQCTDDTHPNYHLITIPNAFETNIRLGTVMRGDHTFTVPFKLTKNDLEAELKRLLSSVGAEYTFEHRTDGYTYLMSGTAADETKIGRGSETSPVARYYEPS